VRIYDLAMVLFVMWSLVALLIAGYIWFVVWRLRLDRRKKEAAAGGPTPYARATPSAPRAPSAADLPSTPTDEPLRVPRLSDLAPLPSESATPASVADLLQGIRLPHDLVPITMMAPRAEVGERVAFVTEGVDPAEVGTAFTEELERLGYEITPMGADRIAAARGDDRLVCQIHLDARYAEVGGKRAFPAVPDGSVVVEVWLPF
jgi:hypothetical protein